MKKNLFLFLLLITCYQICMAQSDTAKFGKENEIEKKDFRLNTFKKIPNQYSDWGILFKNIKPCKNYKCWVLFKNYSFLDKNRNPYFYKGNIDSFKNKIDNIKPNFGFFPECLPDVCFSYILAINQKDSIELINTSEKLKEFIGEVDNLEEALLISKTQGYWFDENYKVGGAYKIKGGYFFLYLLSYSSTPVTYTSVRAIVNKNGILRYIDNKIYKKTNIYYMN